MSRIIFGDFLNGVKGLTEKLGLALKSRLRQNAG
jgi:hypothetical protein